MNFASWKKSEIETEFKACATLGEIISHLEARFATTGEVICEIEVNGMLLKEADEQRFASSNRDDIREIAIRTNTPGLLVRQALVSAMDYIPSLENACVQVSEGLRSSEKGQAHSLFAETVEGCSWLVETLIHVRRAIGGQYISQKWLESEDMLTKIVREVMTAFECSDFVLVADLLEYEVSGILKTWIPVLAQLLKELNTP